MMTSWSKENSRYSLSVTLSSLPGSQLFVRLPVFAPDGALTSLQTPGLALPQSRYANRLTSGPISIVFGSPSISGLSTVECPVMLRPRSEPPGARVLHELSPSPLPSSVNWIKFIPTALAFSEKTEIANAMITLNFIFNSFYSSWLDHGDIYHNKSMERAGLPRHPFEVNVFPENIGERQIYLMNHFVAAG